MPGDFHPALLRSLFKPVVLCIDDDAAGLAIRKLFLEKQGYTVLTATDGHTGVEIARKTSCDAVVLDFEMPTMDGESVALTLKREIPGLPIILLTGFNGNIPASLLSIVDAYALKGAGELLACIARVLDNATRKSPKEAAS
jgi:CheY-like chemotaxis protein